MGGSRFSDDGERRAPPRRGRRRGGRSRSSSSSPYSAGPTSGRRTFLNGASGTASLFTLQGKKGTNQDAMIVWENFGPISDAVFCGVFDGHGPYGHMVARRVRDYLPLKLSTNWEVNIARDEFNRENNISTNSEETAPLSIDEDSVHFEGKEERHPEIFTALKKSFLKAFNVMDKELKLYPNIDCFCSGTTAVTLVKQGQDLVIGNVGDSRAVLGTRDQNDRLIAVQLTVDLKPNLPKEAERIKRCRGRVFALRDEPDVARVWLPNYNSPGLAMARAFGDFCLKDFGLIAVPEISYRCLTEKDEFVVLATDGDLTSRVTILELRSFHLLPILSGITSLTTLDVLSNKEAVDIVASAPARSSSARTLVESAVRAWRFRYPTSKIDDCAAVCLFLANSDEASSISDGCSDTKMSVTDYAESNNRNKQEEISGCDHVTADGNSTTTEDWSALEGVARVNTLLALPKFNDTGRSAGPKAIRSDGRCKLD